jgi:D-sedoheptulose 7-phosphate isomerase
MEKEKFISASLKESAETKLKIARECNDSILDAVGKIVEAYNNGNKLLLCGNGGSAADCQHIATELMIRLNHNISRPALAAIALTTDTSNLTAGGNDIGFENVFARNVEGIGIAGDVLVAISTSGNAPNVINAVKMAHKKGLQVIGLLGGSGGKLKTQISCVNLLRMNFMEVRASFQAKIFYLQR